MTWFPNHQIQPIGVIRFLFRPSIESITRLYIKIVELKVKPNYMIFINYGQIHSLAEWWKYEYIYSPNVNFWVKKLIKIIILGQKYDRYQLLANSFLIAKNIHNSTKSLLLVKYVLFSFISHSCLHDKVFVPKNWVQVLISDGHISLTQFLFGLDLSWPYISELDRFGIRCRPLI